MGLGRSRGRNDEVLMSDVETGSANPQRSIGRVVWSAVRLVAVAALLIYPQFALHYSAHPLSAPLTRFTATQLHKLPWGYHAAVVCLMFVLPAVLMFNFRRNRAQLPALPRPERIEPPPRCDWTARGLFGVAFGLQLLIIALEFRSAFNTFRPWHLWLWFGGWLFAALGGWRIDRSRGLRSNWGLDRKDVLIVAGLLAFGAAFYCYDLHHWRYWDFGDEGFFWDLSAHLTLDRIVRFFGLDTGIYGHHPMFGHIFANMIMRIFGLKNGFPMTTIVPALLAVGAMYMAVRQMFNRWIAFSGAFLLLSSFMFREFAHYGINYNYYAFPVLLALYLFIAAWRGRSALLFVLAGIASGLAPYMFLSGLFIFLIIGMIFLFLIDARKYWKPYLRWYALGVSVVLLTLVLNAQFLWHTVAQQSMFHKPIGQSAPLGGADVKQRVGHIAYNAGLTLIGPYHLENYYCRRHEGDIVQPVTGTLYAIGILSVLFNLLRGRFYVFLFCLSSILIISVGGIQPYDPVSPTRLVLLAPFFIYMAVLGLETVQHWLRRRLQFPRWVFNTLVILLLAGDMASGIYHMEVSVPAHAPFSYINVVARARQSSGDDAVIYWANPSDDAPDFELLPMHARLHGVTSGLVELREDSLASLPPRPGYYIMHNRSVGPWVILDQLQALGWTATRSKQMEMARFEEFSAWCLQPPAN